MSISSNFMFIWSITYSYTARNWMSWKKKFLQKMDLVVFALTGTNDFRNRELNFKLISPYWQSSLYRHEITISCADKVDVDLSSIWHNNSVQKFYIDAISKKSLKNYCEEKYDIWWKNSILISLYRVMHNNMHHEKKTSFVACSGMFQWPFLPQ